MEQALGAAVGPAKEPEIVQIDTRIQGLIDLASKIQSEAYAANDRMYGPRPETEGANKVAECRGGQVGEVQNKLERLNEILNDASREVSRLASVV